MSYPHELSQHAEPGHEGTWLHRRTEGARENKVASPGVTSHFSCYALSLELFLPNVSHQIPSFSVKADDIHSPLSPFAILSPAYVPLYPGIGSKYSCPSCIRIFHFCSVLFKATTGDLLGDRSPLLMHWVSLFDLPPLLPGRL